MLFAAGLCFAGCAAEPETREPAESTASQTVATGVRCSDKAWRVNFYSDATLTTVVGWMTCTCFGPEDLQGVTSNFTSLVFERDCSLQ
ncbi:MAG TPA: hypothetical protein VF469_07075 [Kofleriaceae bacterium]